MISGTARPAAPPHRPRPGAKRVAIALLSLLLAPGTLPAAPDTLAPEAGLFLVATARLEHTSFKDTVIIIVGHDHSGSLGLAINRSTDIPLKDYFPDSPELQQSSDRLWLGGPVRPDSIFVLMRTQRAHAGMRQIAGDLYFTPGIGALAHSLPRATREEPARAYAGYTGWHPGQLEHEIARGDWQVVRHDPAIVFDSDLGTLHQRLLRKPLRGRWI